MEKRTYVIIGLLAIFLSLGAMGFELINNKNINIGLQAIIFGPILFAGIFYLFIGAGKSQINKASELSLKFMIATLIVGLIVIPIGLSFTGSTIILPWFITIPGTFIFVIISIINNITHRD